MDPLNGFLSQMYNSGASKGPPNPFLEGLLRGEAQYNAVPFLNESLRTQETERSVKEANLQKLMAELDRYKAMTPNEIDMSNFKGAEARTRNNPGFLETMMRGEEDKAKGLGLQNTKLRQENDLEAAIQPGKIAGTNMDNMNKSIEGVVRMMQVAGPQLAQMEPGAAQNMYLNVVSQLPPGIRERAPSRYNPETFARMETAIVNSLAHQRKLAEIKDTGAWHLEQTKEQGKNQRAVQGMINAREDARAKAKVKSIWDNFIEAARKGRDENMVAMADIIINNPGEFKENQIETARKALAAAKARWATREATKRDPRLSGGQIQYQTGADVTREMGAVDTPATNTGIPGVVRK